MPLLKNYTTLPDGRTICERDARTVVLDNAEAMRICAQVKSELDSQFVRFITFPDTNVTLELMDRVTLHEQYKVIGKDFTCPNALGFTETKTNAHGFEFRISLLSGLPREQLITTCVHEYTHAWINENTPLERKGTIGKDAVEGFCELVSFLFANQQGYSSGAEEILGNTYTRGQIHLFIAAEQAFGFNELAEWMKYGESELLVTNDLVRVRQLVTFASSNRIAQTSTNGLALVEERQQTNSPAIATVQIVYPETLKLKNISTLPTRRLALINDRTFGLNDRAMIRLAATNVSITCLEIRTNSVLIQFDGTGTKQELFLAEK